MSLFIWKDSLRLGVEFMDREHQLLAEALNALFEPMAKGEEPHVLAPLLDALVQQTKGHFASEERAFVQHAYPGAEDHRAKHADLLAQVKQLEADFAAGKVQLTLRAMQYLKAWLTEHIGSADQAFAEFVRAKGLDR